MKKPFHVFSHGLGTDSSTLVRMAYDSMEARREIFPEGFHHLVIFSDLGNEYPETYQELETQRRLVQEMGFEFIHLTPAQGYHPAHVGRSDKAGSIADWWQESNCIGMTAGDKRCSDRWKVQPIWDYVSSRCEDLLGQQLNTPRNRKAALTAYADRYGDFLLTIGFAAGEEKRMLKTVSAKRTGWRKRVVYTFPLIEMGMNRADCNNYFERQGITPPRPSNCMFCFYQSPAELVALKRHYPNHWKQWTWLEDRKLKAWAGRSKKNNGVKGVNRLDFYHDKALTTIDPTYDKPLGQLTDKQLAHVVQYHGGCVKNGM